MTRPPFLLFPTLISPQLLLRQIMPSDLGDIVEISFYNATPAATAAEAWQMQQQIDKDYQQGNSIHWGIALPGSDTIIGTCGFYRGFDGNSGELGCVLKPAFQGYGLMSKALQLAIDFGFSHLRLARITAVTAPINERAVSLLTRLGFAQSCTVRDNLEFVILTTLEASAS